MKENKKFIKESLIILFVGILINIACFLMPLVVQAAGSGEAYYFPFESGYNQNNIPVNQSFISSQLADKKVKFIVCYADFSSSYPNRMRYLVLSQDTTDFNIYGVISSGYGGSHFSVDANSYNGFVLKSYLDWGDGTDIVYQFDYTDGSAIYELRNWASAIDNNNVYYSRQDLHKNGLSGQDILIYGYDAPPGTTEFQNSALTGHALNNSKPTAPTITAPNIDTSLSVIENVKILFTWLGDTIKSLLKWIIDSIADYFDNLVSNIKSFIDSIITAINNGFMNVYNNIQSLFYPVITFFTAYAKGIQDFIDEITDSQTGIIPFLKTQIANIRTNIASMFDNMVTMQNWLINMGNAILNPYDQSQIELFISRSTFVSSFRTLSTNLTSFVTNFFDIAEPQTLTFTLDFSNAYYDFGQCELSFDWLNPYKVPIRACLVGMLCLSVLNNLIEDLPSMFSGGGSHSKGTSK